MDIIEKNISENESSLGVPIYKPQEYCRIYEEFLESRREKKVVLVEFGVGYGGSLQMWAEFLGKDAMIFGVDNDVRSEAKGVENNQIKIIVGDQGDSEFLKNVGKYVRDIDVLIDDCSHSCEHQIETFEILFPLMSPGSIYFCEDANTSYREPYGGGYQNPKSFIEYCKRLIDGLHLNENFKMFENETEFKRICDSIESIHFFKTLVVIQKRG